ncbi:butyrate kinase [Listeria floridensis FSL S10-1187]|uniref:Probable butyrate kinase n=1 Tax=Listeria floridensis FSL S10-1187 TaxID=1265817 RepID=A0ABP3AY03_9LIST|nr:butyrate kinase [Listeria floridensis]EUJ31799.1 butyrate kinase [Listeria floridensis FSL S10-1187]
MSHTVLAINPGSTSTKIAIYDGEELRFEEEMRHSFDELKKFETILDQLDFRKEAIVERLEQTGFKLAELDAVVGRGGLLRPLKGGTYEVTKKMVNDLKIGVSGQHASNLGGLIAKDLSTPLGIKAYIVDPVVVDELIPTSRISGHAAYERISIFHALNHKATARKVAKQLGKTYEESRFVIAHLGGGISVAAHLGGEAIDVNNALGGEGPFSPERSGTLPMSAFLEACFEPGASKAEMQKQLVGEGGIISYFGTNDMREIERRIEAGDAEAALVFDAMAIQVSKEIAAVSVYFKGNFDGIILTGGLARSQAFTDKVTELVSWIGRVILSPGEDELKALNEGTQRILAKVEQAKEY